MKTARLDLYRFAFPCPSDTSPPRDLGQVTKALVGFFPPAKIELTHTLSLASQLWSIKATGKKHLALCKIHLNLKRETGPGPCSVLMDIS